MKGKEFEKSGDRRYPLRSLLAGLLFVALGLSSCGDEKEIGQEPLSEGRVPVTLSMVTTKGESSSDEIRESKMYIYCQGPGESRYTLTQVVDFAGKGTQMVEFAAEDLTAGHLYRFLSYVSFSDREHYKDDENREGEYIRSSWHYLDGDELKDLDDGIGKSTWEDIRLLYTSNWIESNYFTDLDKEYVQFDYYNASKSNGLQIMQDQKIEATLTGMRGQFVIDFFKSPDGTFSNAEATSDGKSLFFAGDEVDVYITGHYGSDNLTCYLFDETELKLDLKLAKGDQFNLNNLATAAMLEDEETDPWWLVSGTPKGSERFYSSLVPPGVYQIYLYFEAEGKETNLSVYDVNILPATRTVIKAGKQIDRIWENSGSLGFEMQYLTGGSLGFQYK